MVVNCNIFCVYHLGNMAMKKEKTHIEAFGIKNPKGNLILSSLSLDEKRSKYSIRYVSGESEAARHSKWLRRNAAGYECVKVKIIEA